MSRMSAYWSTACAALVVSGCSLDLATKRGCTTRSDCIDGYVCSAGTCTRGPGGGTDTGNGEEPGEPDGGGDEQRDAGPHDGATHDGASEQAMPTPTLWLRADQGFK